MAYKNRMPVLSRIDKGVRDNDFIPISELKEFDKKLNKIIELFESTKNTDTSDANSLAKKMKDIEYNMADALVFDENNNIIGYNTITTDDGKEIPKYGPDAIYNMLNTLEEYYGNFVTLMGSDPNIDNWKIDLDAYFTEAITLFKNKLNGVFRNSALAATMEAKNDKTNDYVLNDKVSLKKGQIMRLNPDLQSYIRNVNLLPSEQNTDFIAFEVGELEKDSLVFNLKIQNGFMWVNLNVVLDNGKWFISREKVLGKDLENKFKINVFKYKNGDKTFYVFCLNTDYPELDEYYNFEIEGLLVNGYSFNATGLTVDKHNKYYSYTLVEDTSVDPLYNETYYTKSSEDYTDENGAKITREIYIPETHLTVFREGVEYYVRSVNFSFIHSFDFINDELDGNINKDDILKDKNNQLVVEDIKYRGTNKALKVDYEVSEVFDDNEEADTNNYIANENKLKEDDSVRLYNNEQSLVAVGKSPKKIDNHIAVAYGEKTFDIVDLRPGDVVNTNAYLDRDASNTVYNDIHGNIERTNTNITLETIIEGEEIEKNRLVKFDNGNSIYLQKNGNFVFFDDLNNNQSIIKNIGDEIRSENDIYANKYQDVIVEQITGNYAIVSSTQLEDNITTASGLYVKNPSHISNVNYSGQTYKCNHGKNKKLFIIYNDGTISHIKQTVATFNEEQDLNDPVFSLVDDKLFIIGLQTYKVSDSKGSISVDHSNFSTYSGTASAVNHSTNYQQPLTWAKSDQQGAMSLYLQIYDINNKTAIKQQKIFSDTAAKGLGKILGINQSSTQQWSDTYFGTVTDTLYLYVRKRPLVVTNFVPETLDASNKKFLHFFLITDIYGTTEAQWNRSCFVNIDYTDVNNMVLTMEDSAVTSGGNIGNNINKDYDYPHDFVQKDHLVLTNKTVKSGSNYIPTTNTFIQSVQNGSVISTSTNDIYTTLGALIRDHKNDINIEEEVSDSKYFVWFKNNNSIFKISKATASDPIEVTSFDISNTELVSIDNFEVYIPNVGYFITGKDSSDNVRTYAYIVTNSSFTELLTPDGGYVSGIAKLPNCTYPPGADQIIIDDYYLPLTVSNGRLYIQNDDLVQEWIQDSTGNFVKLIGPIKTIEENKLKQVRTYHVYDNELYVHIGKLEDNQLVSSTVKVSDIAENTDMYISNFDATHDFVYYKNNGDVVAKLIDITDFSTSDIELQLTGSPIEYFGEFTKFIKDGETNTLYKLEKNGTFKEYINDKNVYEIFDLNEKEVLFGIDDSLMEPFRFIKNDDYYKLEPGQNPKIYNNNKLYVNYPEVFKYDLMQDPTILDNLIKSNDPILSKKCQTINEYIKNNLVFVNSFRVGILKRSENTVDIIIIPDNADVANGDFYMLFTVNISTDILNKDATERTIVFRKLTKSEDEFVGKKILYQEKWTSICSNNIITLAIGKNGLFYSYNSDVFHRLVKPMTENTHEEIIFDDSFEVFYDNFLYFYAVKANKKSTDHTYYYSKDGIIWRKSNMDIIFPDMKDQPYYPKIYTTGLNRIFFVGEYGSILVDNVGFENITSKYTEAYVTQEEVQYYDPIHSYNLGFACTDLFFDNNRYFALDSTNHQLKYAATTSNIVDVKELFTSWTTVTVNGLDLSGDKIKDYKLYGYDLRGVIVYGSGKTDPTAIGLWYSAWNAPDTFTKSDLPADIGVKAFYPCVSIWKQDNGSEVSKDYIYLLGSDDKTYKSEDFGHTWVEETGTREVLHVGSYNNYYIIKNTDTGVITGRSLDGLPTIASDFTSPLVEPKACMSRNLHATVGYNIIHVTDNNTGKILFTTDYEHWYPASVISYNPVTELHDSGNLVVGNTVMYPIAVNRDYDESYCPTKNTNVHKKKFINDRSNYVSIDNNGYVVLNIDNDKYTISNSNGINPNDFLVMTLSNSKIIYCFISEYNKGIWISDDVEPGTFNENPLTHIDLDIYVENGFQNKDGFFIYGKDDNNKTKLYFLPTRKMNLHEIEFVEKLSTDFIDYIKPHNDDIVISTYEFENPYDKYSYKPETKEFIKSSAIDISDVYSFNNTFEYKGDIYFVNGSGSNPSIRNTVDNNEGIFVIRKSVDTLKNIEYNITPFIKSSEIYKDISPIDKIYTGVLQVEKDKFVLVTSGKNQDNSDFVTNKFLIDFSATTEEDKLKKIENVNRFDNPVLHDIGEIIDTENFNSHVVNEQNRRTSVTNIPSFGLIVQRHSFGCDINDLTESNLSLENKVDSYYFDKENRTLKFNSYGITGRTDFKLNSEKIAFASTVNTNKTAIIMALGQDNAFGIFDRNNKCIKVVKTGYTDRTTGQDIFIEFDPKYINLQSVIIGRNNTDLQVYGLFYGKFPRFNYDIDTGERYLDYSQSITVYKVFSINYDSLISAGDTLSINEEKNFTYDSIQNEIRINLKNYIKNQGYLPSEDLNLTDSDIQVIAISNNIVYENTYSLIVWNSKNKCLQAYTKFKYDSSLDNPNESSNVNQKIGSNVEGLDFERNSLYVDIADPVTDRTTMKYMKFGSSDDSYIETKLFVANLTNRKNHFFTSVDDYKKDILFDSTKYLKYMQTRYGVFRYTSEEYVNAVNKRLNTTFEFNDSNFNYINSAPRSYRNVESMFYFTPEGSSSIIPIHIGNKGCVTDIWEMGEALFVQTKEYIEYIFDEQEVYKLYKLIMIPDSNRSEIISIHDPRYFVEMDTKYARIYDMKNTLEGLICVGTEPKGISDPASGVNNDYYTGNTYVFWYNGNDFITIKTFDMNDTSNWVKFNHILNTTSVPLLIASKEKQIYKYTRSTNLVEKETKYDSLANVDSSLSLLDCLDAFVRSQTYEANYPKPIVDIFNEDNIIYIQGVNDSNVGHLFEVNLDKNTMKVLKNYGEVDRDIFINEKNTQGFIRYPIVRPSDTTRQYNSDLIEDILLQKIPVDKTLKVVGSLVCDGVRFNVSAMHIETHTGVNNKTFKTLVFNIDKHFRSDLSKEIFTEAPGTIRIGFGEIDRNIQKMNIIIFY